MIPIEAFIRSKDEYNIPTNVSFEKVPLGEKYNSKNKNNFSILLC